MPSPVIAVRNVLSVELMALAGPAVATAARPNALATSAVPANVARRAEADMGLLADVVCSGRFRADISVRQPPWRILERFLVRSAAGQPYLSHHSCRSSMFGPWASASSRSAFLDHTKSGPSL